MKFSEQFVKFRCPSYTDPVVVLKEIRELLVKYKCEMTECGDSKTLERRAFQRATGAGRGKSLPPRYRKNVSEDFYD